jgi:hypothetical protein
LKILFKLFIGLIVIAIVVISIYFISIVRKNNGAIVKLDPIDNSQEANSISESQTQTETFPSASPPEQSTNTTKPTETPPTSENTAKPSTPVTNTATPTKTPAVTPEPTNSPTPEPTVDIETVRTGVRSDIYSYLGPINDRLDEIRVILDDYIRRGIRNSIVDALLVERSELYDLREYFNGLLADVNAATTVEELYAIAAKL